MTLHPRMARLMDRAGVVMPPAKPTPAALTRWDTLYATVYRHDVTPEQRVNAVRAVGAGFPSRESQLAAYERSNPIRAETQADFETWVLDWRNDINRGLGKPPYTLAESREINGPKSPPIIPDRVVVLSLDSRPDRWAGITASAKTSCYASQWTIERYRARPPAEMIVPDWWQWQDTVYATGMDHRAIIEQSYVAGYESVLILEDDAILQEGFDAAYEAACRSLPPDWMGLWLSSDGHMKPPIKVAPGLVRSTDQAMIHAYLLSRRGMHRVWHHLTTCYRQIIDGATEDLMGIEPHFYATETNAVRQFGDRFIGERVQFYEQAAASK